VFLRFFVSLYLILTAHTVGFAPHMSPIQALLELGSPLSRFTAVVPHLSGGICCFFFLRFIFVSVTSVSRPLS
jgi:hypothetical protein